MMGDLLGEASKMYRLNQLDLDQTCLKKEIADPSRGSCRLPVTGAFEDLDPHFRPLNPSIL